jgi:hypothetical protein
VWTLLWTVLGTITSVFRRGGLALENLALRQQLAVVIRTAVADARLRVWDRAFWVMLSQGWARWRGLGDRPARDGDPVAQRRG